MKGFYFVFFFILLVSYNIYAQKIVVSEYYNVTGDPQGEWTELLVVDDNIDIVGYTLRDNSGSTPPPSQWTGGVRFKDHPLWRHLRAGTIIVINHRYSPYQSVDVDKRDGYIEIDAENEEYFEKRCFSCILGPEWYQKALNIAQESDILQIIDQNDNHIHALAHMPETGGDWLNMPNPKVCYVGSIPRGGVTIRVCPGRDISAYNKGFDTRGEETAQSSDYVTKGKPNNRQGYIDINQQFWRSLREPQWVSPTLNAKVYKDSVVLSWNSINDPYPQDSVSGYIIVRIPFDLLGSALHPVDGKIYNIGDNLGSAQVIGIINYSQTTRFVDKITLECGVRYVYRVYAFRYRADDFHEDGQEVYARGRSYNQRTFAQVEVEKPIPPQPEVIFAKGNSKICEGDTVILTVRNGERLRRVSYKWYKDGNKIVEDKDSLVVISSGDYKIEIVDSLGCSSISQSVSVNVLSYPNLMLYANDKIVTKDTTVILCPGDLLNLKILGWIKYRFYRDNSLVEENAKSEWVVSSSGSYYFTASNDICISQTPVVTVKFLNLRLKIIPDSLTLFVDKNEVYKDTTIVIQNLGKDTVIVSNVVFKDAAFELLSPSLPFTILPNRTLQVIIRFKPLRSGIYYSQMELQKSCGLADTVFLEGKKAKSVLIYTADTINFGILPGCIGFATDTSFKLVNDSDEEVLISSIELQSPFEILSPKNPVKISKDGSLAFEVRFNNNGTGDFNGILKVRYIYSGIIDSLEIPVRGAFQKVNYSISKEFPDTLVFDECEVSKKVYLKLFNKSNFELVTNFSDAEDIKLRTRQNTIERLDSLIIELEIFPKDLGYNNTKLYYTIQPCDILDSIEVTYIKKGIIVSFSSDTLDFGKIYTCQKQSVYSIPVNVFVIGDTIGLTKVRDLTIPEGFNCTLSKGDVIRNGQQVVFHFVPNQNGVYSGVASFVLEPCGYEYSIFLRAEYVHSSFFVSVDTIDFGEVEIGKKIQKSFYIKNVGDTLILAENVNVIDRSNYSISPYGFVNTLLNKFDSLVFVVVFEPQAEGYSETICEVKLGFPCDTILKIVLKGKGIMPNPDKLFVYAENHRFKPFTIARVPVRFKLTNSFIGSLDSLKFNISYYPRVFNVSAVYSGSFPLTSNIDFLDGKIYVAVNTKNQSLSEGTICYMEGMVLIGDQKFSNIDISDFNVFGVNNIEIVVGNGKVEIDSVCAPDLRLISSETLPEFDVSFIENNVSLTVLSYFENLDFALYVYDLLGNCVLKQSVDGISKGQHKFLFPFFGSRYQKYFCVIRYGNSFSTSIISSHFSE
jgi:archaellum component FlaG (FlaF/FlaG flagellin family)